MTKHGQFIVVEGLEGAGKSTAINTIKAVLNQHHYAVLETREPGGTGIGEVIRGLIKEKSLTETLEARSELLLFYAARVQLIEQVIRPTLEKGTWVLADRFELSTFAYQGAGRGLDINFIQQLSSFCLNQFKPDLIFFLDISPEQGLERVKRRGPTDRMEEESLDFFTRIYEGYHQLIKTMPNVVRIDASQPIEIVQKSILAQLDKFLSQNATV